MDLSLSVGESIICSTRSVHEVLGETHAEVSHVEELNQTILHFTDRELLPVL